LWFSSKEKLEGFVGGLREVMSRHDILRTAVLWEQLPRAVQVVYREASLAVQELTLRGDQDAQEQLLDQMRAGRPLDLRQAPLLRVQIAADPHSKEWYALLHTHHLVFDNQSLQVMLQEVLACAQGRSAQLPA